MIDPTKRRFEERPAEAGSSAQRHPEQNKLLVVGFDNEGIANHLAVFANFVGFAEEYGHRLVNPTFHPYAESFRTTRRNAFCRYPPRGGWRTMPGINAIRKTHGYSRMIRLIRRWSARVPWIARSSGLHQFVANEQPSWVDLQDLITRVKAYPDLSIYGPDMTVLQERADGSDTLLESPEIRNQIDAAKVIFAIGWTFRAPRCVQRHADKIRVFFRPAKAHAQASARMIDGLRGRCEVVVGVHVRRGDYRDWEGGRYFYPVSRYVDWMRQFVALFPNRKVGFLVCSDEPRDPGEFAGLTVQCGNHTHVVEDLYALAGCDYLFGPPSTFSLWAAFYGNRRICMVTSTGQKLALTDFRTTHV